LTTTKSGATAVDVVREAFSAVDAGDLTKTQELYAKDLAYHLVNQKPTHSRTWNGLDHYLQMVGSTDKPTGGTFRYEILDLWPAGDELVVVHGASSAICEGREASGLHWALVARVVDGVITQMVDVAETKLDEFWRPTQP
jgi:ketosteroid isomerase-like protein